jgi:hypothetical protein
MRLAHGVALSPVSMAGVSNGHGAIVLQDEGHRLVIVRFPIVYPVH